MADKKLNAVSTASDGAYIYAEDASGNQIKISKADLALVVAGLLPAATLSSNGFATPTMVKTTPVRTVPPSKDTYVEICKCPINVCGAVILTSGFQESSVSQSISILMVRNGGTMLAPSVTPLLNSNDRLPLYGKMEGNVLRICVKVTSAYMHVTSASLHPNIENTGGIVSDISGWSFLV